MAESQFASPHEIVVDQLKLNAKKHYQIRKRDWVSGKIAQMKENSTLNWRSTSTTSPIKSYRFLPEVLNMDKSTNRRDLSPCWQPLIDIWKKTWLQVLNYTHREFFHSKLELEGKVKHIR